MGYHVAVRVTVLELPARFGRAREQLALASELLAKGPASDLVLLGECALTGYLSPERDFDLTPFAEAPDGPTSRAARALASRHQAVVVFPLVEREGDSVYNTMIAFGPGNHELLRYRKRHPWYPEAWATPGEAAHPVVSIGELRVTIATCFDVHFLASEALHELRTSDLLLFPSAWVDETDDARARTLPELARAHGIAIANANWGVGEPCVRGQGGSRIYGGDGRVLAAATHGRADADVQPRSSA